MYIIWLKNFGADVIVAGENWNEANEQAKLALQQVREDMNKKKFFFFKH